MSIFGDCLLGSGRATGHGRESSGRRAAVLLHSILLQALVHG